MKKKLVLIGSSTGGPGHLEKIIAALPSEYKNTIIIAQHMDEMFIPSLVHRLANITSINTVIATENETIQNPSIIFTQGKLSQLKYLNNRDLSITSSNITRPYLPNVNCLFSSASKLTQEFDILACLSTGIGDDGADGIIKLKHSGATCIAEEESSSIVYGMPHAAFELDQTLKQLPLDKIIQEIKEF